MKEILQKHGKKIAIAAIILVIGIIVYIAIRKAGMKKGASSVLADLPNPSVGGDYTDDERRAIRTYCDWLNGEFGWLTIHSIAQWTAFSLEKDRILIGVANQYALDNPGKNLYNQINDTTFVDPELWSIKDTILPRLKTDLNI